MRADDILGAIGNTPLVGLPTFGPRSDVKITRNIKGKANVKPAEAGFRQKALFV